MKALVLLSGLGLLALLAEIFRFKRALMPLALLGLIITFLITVFDWNTNITHFGMMRFDNFAVAFTAVMTAVAFFWFLSSESFFQEESSLADHFALIFFALAGGVVLVSYTNMAMLFIGIEILSISMYVLAGSRKSDLFSNEAAFKYFLMGSFATGFLLFGIALIYGVTGSFDLAQIGEYVSANGGASNPMFLAGVLMMLIGLSFKVSAAPFHFWAPDVYQGSPTPVTAFMATIVKTAAFAGFFRLFFLSFSPAANDWSSVVWALAAITLILGNVTAVYQSNVKRMLAYSSVAHAGYMMLALLAISGTAATSILYYTIAYSVGSLAAFTVLQIVGNARGTDSVDAFNGLGKRNPLLAVAMTVALLSLAGIPPTGGFFAKYFIFTTAIQADHIWIVLIAVIGSLISVYYYFRIIIAMFFRESMDDTIEVSPMQKLLLVMTILLTLALGILPDLITRLSLFNR
jgi:NADH-quinone oxidoreductase subunit N